MQKDYYRHMLRLDPYLSQTEMEFKEFEPRFKSAKTRQNPV